MSKIKTWKERLQNTIYGYPEEMQCREDEVDELRTRIYQLEQELANVSEQLAEAKKDQARYLKLIETENFCPSDYSCLWGLHMSDKPVYQVNFNKKYNVESEMRDAIRDAILKFQFQISLASTLGVLEIVKKELMQEAEND